MPGATGKAGPPGRADRDRSLKMFSVWFRMHRDGDPVREIADAAGKPIASVHAGIKAYEVHLETLEEGDRLDALAGFVTLYEDVGMVLPRWLRRSLKF